MTVSCPLYVESKQQNEQIEIETDSYIQRKKLVAARGEGVGFNKISERV